MLKTIFKILIVIFVIGLIFVGVMWAMQPTGPLGDEQTPAASDGGKELEKAKGEASKLLSKVKLPLAKKEDEKEELTKKQKKSSSKKIDAKKDELENDPAYKFPKNLATDRLSYTLHIDAFLFKEFADQLIDDLKRKKYPAYGISVWGDERQLWHAVRIGRYLNYETADKELANFNLKERRSARVINLGTLEFFPPEYLETEKTADKKPESNSDTKKKSEKNNKSGTKNNNNPKG
jgi:hypothetical protein